MTKWREPAIFCIIDYIFIHSPSILTKYNSSLYIQINIRAYKNTRIIYNRLLSRAPILHNLYQLPAHLGSASSSSDVMRGVSGTTPPFSSSEAVHKEGCTVWGKVLKIQIQTDNKSP